MDHKFIKFVAGLFWCSAGILQLHLVSSNEKDQHNKSINWWIRRLLGRRRVFLAELATLEEERSDRRGRCDSHCRPCRCWRGRFWFRRRRFRLLRPSPFLPGSFQSLRLLNCCCCSSSAFLSTFIQSMHSIISSFYHFIINLSIIWTIDIHLMIILLLIIYSFIF